MSEPELSPAALLAAESEEALDQVLAEFDEQFFAWWLSATPAEQDEAMSPAIDAAARSLLDHNARAVRLDDRGNEP